MPDNPLRRNLLLVSSSRCHPHGYLDHCEEQVRDLFKDVRDIVFVPYARPGGASWDEYTATAADRFERLGIRVTGIHSYHDKIAAIEHADGIFIGGGNTFVLLKQMAEDGLMAPLRRRIQEGMPYMGTSAGSNVAGLSIGTSNDMPIAYPPTFEALGVVDFNLNPHYPAALPDPTHRGETRDDRIHEFHVFNPQPVISLHEDGMLRVVGDGIELLGERPAYLFRPATARESISPGSVHLP